jgi:hypothetical protein
MNSLVAKVVLGSVGFACFGRVLMNSPGWDAILSGLVE